MDCGFDSIAGYEAEKEELKALCEIFKNRDALMSAGAKLPKGIIFYGGVGNGKTLFAKVMAKECGLRVFKINLGDVENESAICKQIKKTFAQAAKCKEPAMVFFDEVDKVLPSLKEDYCTDRSKTVLAQLLTLIDGMDSASNVIFVATCNYYGALPEALTRPGRIDKKIAILNPSYSSRVAILDYYVKKTTCRFETALEEIAKQSAGFCSAALETLVNECVLRSKGGFVSRELLLERLCEIKNEDIPRDGSDENDFVIACANLGALVVSKCLDGGDYVLNLDKRTASNCYFNRFLFYFDSDFQPYDGGEDGCEDGNDCDYDDDDCDYDGGGWNDDDDGDDDDDCGGAYYTKDDYLNAVTVLYGRYAAEELALGKVYDNLNDDLELIEKILRYASSSGLFGLDMIFNPDLNEGFPYSEERVRKVRELLDETADECYRRAKAIVENNVGLIRELTPILIERKTIDKAELEKTIAELAKNSRAD